MAIAEGIPGRTGQGFELPLSQELKCVQRPLIFMEDFLSHARAAKERLLGESMTFEAGHITGLIMREFEKAKQRSIQTIFKIDTNSGKLEGKTDTLERGMNEALLKDLEAHEGLLQYKNPPRGLFPKIPVLGKYSGRDHKKVYIADDIAWIGGINATENGFNNIDFMVKIINPQVVNALAIIFENIEHEEDYEIPTGDPQTKILIDVGNRGKSLILDTTSKYVEDSIESVHNMSMLKPDGKFHKALNDAAIEGSEVLVLTSDPNELEVDLSRGIQKLSRMIPHRKFYNMQEGGMIHAKLTIVDHKIAIFGSHNMSSQGVFLGTEEIAMITTNPQLVRSLENFFQEELERVKAA